MPYGKDQMNFNCLQMKVSELPLFLCCFGSTYILKFEDKHGSCTRMTRIIVKCSTFLCPQYMKWHVCKIYNQPYIYLLRRPVSFVFLAYFVFYNSEAVDVDIWDRVQHLSFYINIMSAGSQQLVDVIELSPIKMLVCVRWINTWYWLALAEPTRDIILDLSEHTENFRKDSSKVPQHNQIMIEMSNPNQEPPSSSKPLIRTWRTLMLFAPEDLSKKVKIHTVLAPL